MSEAKFKPVLGLWDATMIVAGSMIGSGIFIVSADILRNVGGSGVNVKVDVISNVADKVACGAFCVSPAITVCAAEVLIAPVSGATKTGIPLHAKLAVNNAAAGKRIR
jgi:hypothetical protein